MIQAIEIYTVYNYTIMHGCVYKIVGLDSQPTVNTDPKRYYCSQKLV